MNREDALDIIGDSDVAVAVGSGLELIVGRQDRMVRIGLSAPGALNIAIELLVRCRESAIEEVKCDLARKRAEEGAPCH